MIKNSLTSGQKAVATRRENNRRGNYYKYKTKKRLEDDGYEVEYLEKYQSFFKDGKVIHVKRDLFGCDMLAMNGEEMRFIQVKFGRSHITEGIKAFFAHKFPPGTQREIWVWESKMPPEIIPAVQSPDTGNML